MHTNVTEHHFVTVSLFHLVVSPTTQLCHEPLDHSHSESMESRDKKKTRGPSWPCIAPLAYT